MSGDPRMNLIIQKFNSPAEVPNASHFSSGDSKTPAAAPAVAILGFPSDLGTARNGGRTGGVSGPEHFRKFLRTKGTVVDPETGISIEGVPIVDAGDAFPAGAVGSTMTLEEAHSRMRAGVRSLLDKGYIPFCVGGSNDQSYCTARALLDSKQRLAVVNIDAHLDVRPLVENKEGELEGAEDGQTVMPATATLTCAPGPPAAQPRWLAHSGSPFRLLLCQEGFSGSSFCVFAAQGMQCSAQHTRFITERGGRVKWLSELASYPAGVVPSPGAAAAPAVEHFKQLWLTDECAPGKDRSPADFAGHDAVFVSFDIDSVVGHDAPGVSCPSPIGLSAADALAIAFESGKKSNVKAFDISELCPAVEDYRTPMLAAFMFYRFVQGLVVRAQTK